MKHSKLAFVFLEIIKAVISEIMNYSKNNTFADLNL